MTLEPLEQTSKKLKLSALTSASAAELRENPDIQASHEASNDRGSHVPPLTESQVGINAYLSDLPGFSGIIKHRYADHSISR